MPSEVDHSENDLRVAFITTVNHNVGDDLVREGIRCLLETKLGPVKPFLIHKHFPATVRGEVSWLQEAGFLGVLDRMTGGRGLALSRLLERLPLAVTGDKILGSDMLVQSGAPVYWCFPDGGGCHTNEWFHPLIERRYLLIKDRVPLLNIGAGSCQPYHSDGLEFERNSECMDYIRRLFHLSTLTTVRDRLAQSVLNLAKLNAPLLCCPSIFARDRLGVTPRTGEFAALNFMPLGGHYDLGQQVNTDVWARTFCAFCEALSRVIPVVLVCHTHKEFRIASRLLPNFRRVLVDSAATCLAFYSRVRCYIGSRVHGALAAASFGHPAFVVGSDSRATMGEEMHISSGFVSDMSVRRLMEEFERLKRSEEEFAALSVQLREHVRSGYMNVLDGIENRVSSRQRSLGAATP